MAASPKALYKRASKLLQRCGCDSKHDAPALEALKQCTLLEVAAEGDSLSAAPACCHDIDLGPDEPAYVIAWAHLQSAKLFSKPGAAPQRERLDAACVHLASCLAVFPSYVAAHTAAAQLWYHVSDSSQALDGAVGHLRAALAAAEQVEAKDGGLLVSESARL